MVFRLRILSILIAAGSVGASESNPNKPRDDYEVVTGEIAAANNSPFLVCKTYKHPKDAPEPEGPPAGKPLKEWLLEKWQKAVFERIEKNEDTIKFHSNCLGKNPPAGVDRCKRVRAYYDTDFKELVREARKSLALSMPLNDKVGRNPESDPLYQTESTLSAYSKAWIPTGAHSKLKTWKPLTSEEIKNIEEQLVQHHEVVALLDESNDLQFSTPVLSQEQRSKIAKNYQEGLNFILSGGDRAGQTLANKAKLSCPTRGVARTATDDSLPPQPPAIEAMKQDFQTLLYPNSNSDEYMQQIRENALKSINENDRKNIQRERKRSWAMMIQKVNAVRYSIIMDSSPLLQQIQSANPSDEEIKQALKDQGDLAKKNRQLIEEAFAVKTSPLAAEVGDDVNPRLTQLAALAFTQPALEEWLGKGNQKFCGEATALFVESQIVVAQSDAFKNLALVTAETAIGSIAPQGIGAIANYVLGLVWFTVNGHGWSTRGQDR